MSIRLVLDGSALTAYACHDPRAIQLGELLLTVAENGDTTGVPALALIEAYQQADADEARAKLLELAGDEGLTLCLPVLTADLATVAELTCRLPHGQAHSVAEARKHGAYLATYHRAKYADALAAEDILDL